MQLVPCALCEEQCESRCTQSPPLFSWAAGSSSQPAVVFITSLTSIPQAPTHQFIHTPAWSQGWQHVEAGGSLPRPVLWLSLAFWKERDFLEGVFRAGG